MGLLAQVIDGKSFYYLHNAHGDVVQRVSESGDPAPLYRYDAFGNQREPVETDPNPFRYCGEYLDLETNTYYLRARDYSPATGRFLAEDMHWNPGNMIYGDEPQKINVVKDAQAGKETSYTLVPSTGAIRQSGNLYVYGINDPIMYQDPGGKFVITTAILLIAGGAALFGTIGGFVGNHIASERGATGWDKVGYIAAGVSIGALGGGVLGAVAAPAVATATGVGAISVTTAGVSTIAAAGTSFGTMGTLLAQNPNITVNWSSYARHGLERMADRGITQQMVDMWVSTGKVLQQGADKFAYITREGMAVVNSAGKLITTYSSTQYDAAMQEIVNKLYGG